MARQAVHALLFLGLLCSLAPAPQGQDFDLSDALPGSKKQPTTPPLRTPKDDDFKLDDALPGDGKDDPPAHNPSKPKPREPGSSGSFSDSDLSDGTSEGAASPAVIPGIVGTVVVAVAGAISSFIAYQKKKLCFKENAGEEGNVENHPSTKAEPHVQCTLLEK
ncbi:CD99 antigen isoform X3 [Dasypus novemcinctus]|uniref:CD99 antigen isoform X3 n=1 Tax=Dasypus novemcinctus TaxID=9361 RepID=UPI00265E252D|nr:CD99 antigen isoform X3 [Dasypus novemcinctus]